LLDTMIAGIAQARRASLATRTLKHFADADIEITNPWQASEIDAGLRPGKGTQAAGRPPSSSSSMNARSDRIPRAVQQRSGPATAERRSGIPARTFRTPARPARAADPRAVVQLRAPQQSVGIELRRHAARHSAAGAACWGAPCRARPRRPNTASAERRARAAASIRVIVISSRSPLRRAEAVAEGDAGESRQKRCMSTLSLLIVVPTIAIPCKQGILQGKIIRREWDYPQRSRTKIL
jgi:hypothetical protein